MTRSLKIISFMIAWVCPWASALASGSSLTCSPLVDSQSIALSTRENRLERNGHLQGVTGGFLIDTQHCSSSLPLDIPSAVAIARQIPAIFPPGSIGLFSVTEIFIIDSVRQIDQVAESLSGRVNRYVLDGMIVDIDAQTDFKRVYIEQGLINAENKLAIPKNPLQTVVAQNVETPFLKRRKLRPLVQGPKSNDSVFVGGLISISAEPPEGFFAASTAAELASTGWKIGSAEQANVWIYRVPDSRKESYFEFTYSSPDRPQPGDYGNKFKVATGIGPSTHPESSGGREADLLWLGDEQKGPLDRYLRKVSRSKLYLEDLYTERGIIQKLNDRQVVLAGADQRYALTQEGFDSMETNPTIYRRVFDREYDEFLATLFKDSHPDPTNKSYLLATSRGCSQGCAICCSGGLSQFQYFSAERMMTELEKIIRHSGATPKQRINLFLVDSNFNNNPSRIIEFAKLYRASPIAGRFEFFIRHNTVNGFLKADGKGKAPNGALIQAYKDLGIKEIFMGVDSFDDASTVTLKTHKFKVAKDGAASKPIYSANELFALIRALDHAGLYSKGFFLTNNPWVSDFDRIDSYYNLIELWLDYPKFSIDSARDRNVIRLKPFEGSPIGETAQLMNFSNVENERFVAKGPIGEMDELMEFAGLGRPRESSSVSKTMQEFWTGISKIRAAVEKLYGSQDAAKRDYAQWILSKLRYRNEGVLKRLDGIRGCAQCTKIAQDIRNFSRIYAGLPEFDPAVQTRAFEISIESLADGLQKTNPKKGGRE